MIYLVLYVVFACHFAWSYSSTYLLQFAFRSTWDAQCLLPVANPPCGPQCNCVCDGNVSKEVSFMSLLSKCLTFLISCLLTFLPLFLLRFLPWPLGDAFHFCSDATINSGRKVMVQKVILGRGEQSASAYVFLFCPRTHLTFRLREHLWPVGLVRKHVWPR